MRSIRPLVFIFALSTAGPAAAVPYYFVDWTEADPQAGTASGIITLPDLSTVDVDFSVTTASGAPGSFSFAQTNGGINYWNPSEPYISPQVDNAPPDTDIIALVGGSSTTTYTIALSEAIKDPIMDIVSLGRPGTPVTYDFDRPFDIVSQGAGYWGGTSSAGCAADPASCSLQELAGDVLWGHEGHGTIQFIGTFPSFSWVAPTSEFWHGFQFGIRTTERLEPTPTPVPEPPVLLLTLAAALTYAVRRRRLA